MAMGVGRLSMLRIGLCFTSNRRKGMFITKETKTAIETR